MTLHRITIEFDHDNTDEVVTLEDAILSEIDDSPVVNAIVSHTFPSGVSVSAGSGK